MTDSLTSTSKIKKLDFGVKEGWTVLIGDVVSSRKIDERPAFQNALVQHLASTAKGFDGLAVQPDLTAGDEWKAVFSKAGQAVAFLLAIQDAPFDVTFRFGIGFGAMSVPVTPDAKVGHLDGPAFHAARAAINTAKRRGMATVFAGFGELDDHLSYSLSLSARVRADRTPKQNEYIAAMTRSSTQSEVAKRFGVKPGTLSKTLDRAGYNEVRSLEAETIRLLDRHWRSEDPRGSLDDD